MKLSCTAYKCRHYPGSPCCAQCDAPNCVDRCKNHPDRCKAWAKAKPPQKLRAPRKPPVNAEDVVRLYHEGLATVEIGEKLGVSRDRVCAILRKNGISLRRAPVYSRSEISRMWESGMTVRQIARAMGASEGTISSALKKIRGLGEI